MAKSNLVAALDVGTSKVVCFIAEIDNVAPPKIVGIGYQISQGVQAGVVTDIKSAESSILAAVHSAEKMAGEAVDKAMVGISGPSTKFNIISTETKISGREVGDRDVNHLINQGYEKFEVQDEEIIQCIPLSYSIDNLKGIKDPRGMYGEKLTVELGVITASSTVVKNMANCMSRCHLQVDDYVVAPYASGLACLTEDEKRMGVTLIDIGSGNTAIAMFSEGNPVHVESLPVSGAHITRDITVGLSTSFSYAERIKNLYGSVITTKYDEREIIDVPMSDLVSETDMEASLISEDNHVSKAFLTSIIKPRVEEILEMVKKSLDDKGLYKSSGPRVVITGGSSQIQGLKELASHVLQKHVRIGRPLYIEGMAEATKGPIFSTCAGMIAYAAERKKTETGSIRETEILARKGAVNRLLKWFQENF